MPGGESMLAEMPEKDLADIPFHKPKNVRPLEPYVWCGKIDKSTRMPAAFTKAFILFAWLFSTTPVAALDISISTPIHTTSKGRVFAADDSSATKWFNEKLKIDNDRWTKIAIPFFDYGLVNFQHDKTKAILHGRVGKYVCVFFGCGWVDEKFFRNENTIGTIKLELDIFSVFVSGPHVSTAGLKVIPKIGVGVAIAKGQLQRVEADQQPKLNFPLFYLGFDGEYPIGKIGYARLEYDISGISYDYGSASRNRMGLYFAHRVARDIEFFGGINLISMRLFHSDGVIHLSHTSKVLQPRAGVKINY